MNALTPQTTGNVSAPKVRVALWDNARFLFIVLVVIGHTISTIRTDTAVAFAIYAYIYLFHMPAMILLSGLFAKAEVSPKAAKSLIQLIITWLLWEGIWVLLRAVVSGEGIRDSFLVVPSWTLWFLVTLVTLRILLPYIARLRHPLVFSIAVALLSSLLADVGTPFSASRTLIFLPFFVAGWLIRQRGWLDGEWFAKPSAGLRAGAWGLLAAVALAFALTPQLREIWRIDKWLTWRDSYEEMFATGPLGDWQPTEWWSIGLGGIAVAAALLLLAAAMILAALIVVPRGHSTMTVWGARTLFVYLLHGPIIWLGRETGVIDQIGALGVVGVLLLVAVAIGLAVLLSSAWVSRVFKLVIEPRFDGILVRQ